MDEGFDTGGNPIRVFQHTLSLIEKGLNPGIMERLPGVLLLQSHVFVDDQNMKISLAGLAVDDGGDMADALRGIAVFAEAGVCARRLFP